MINKVYYKDGTIYEGEYCIPEDPSKIIHREDGPAIEWANGTREWYLNGKPHREDGPAVERANQTKIWYRHGLIHKEGGPAVELANGTKEWFLNGNLHREDGPAIESASQYEDEEKRWHLNGEELTILSQEYLIKYMKLTGETLTTLLLHPDNMIRNSVKKYEWR